MPAGTVFVAVPMGGLSSELLLEGLKGSVQETLDDMQTDYDRFTSEWTEPPVFWQSIRFTGGEIVGTVGTDDQVFNWVNNGTQGGYLIPESPPADTKDGNLHYQEDFEPQTVPHSMDFNPGGGKSGDWISPYQVEHPGIEGRHWDELIQYMYQPLQAERVRRHLTVALEKMRRMASY